MTFKFKKVLVLCTTDNMIYHFLQKHILDLVSYGAEVDCVCKNTGFWFGYLQNKGFNLIDIDIRRSPLSVVNCKAYKDLVKLQKKNHYDLILCQQPVGSVFGRLLAKKFHIPVVYTCHGFSFYKNNNFLKNFLIYNVEKKLSKYTDVLVTLNEDDYNSAKDFKCKKLYLINGIGYDREKYDNSPFDKEQFKESLGIKKGDLVVLTVAELIRRKNYVSMLNVMSKIIKKMPNVKYVVCGVGKASEEVHGLAKKLGITDNVIFLGYRTDINRIMQVSDVFYLQSLHEGLTMSIIEASDFGLPLVISNVRGNKELFDPEGGFATEPLDKKSQEKYLIKLLNDKELRVKMGNHNRLKVKDYNIDIIREDLKKIYSECGFFEE